MSQKKKKIRENFRNEVFKRDNNECVVCGEQNNLDAHHIIDRNEMPNGGYVKENGISLCPKHHDMAELFHKSDGKNFVEFMHPDDLFKIIGSNKELAIKKSRELHV